MDSLILSLKNITKTYPGVIAINDLSLDFKKGEVHALMGENGAGKSTLIKIISGAIQSDSGSITIENNIYSEMTPKISRAHGIEVIYQEFNLIDELSAAENICLGEKTGKLVNFDAMRKKVIEIFKQFDIDIDPDALVRNLPSAQQQIVEIAKAISKNVKVLIMDEPTAPLTVREVDKLYDIIAALKKKGVTIIYISHRLEEIFMVSDRVTIMRDGAYVDTKNTSETDRQELISLMVGRELKETYPSRNKDLGELGFEVKNISGNGNKNISFSVRKGEILGISGLVGAGRTELVRGIFGADKKDSGEIFVNGKLVDIKSPKDAIKYGIGFIPEDRKTQGCFLDMSIFWNISIANIKSISKNTIVNIKKEKDQCEKYRELLKIKTPSIGQKVMNLSGGNQQKVVLAKVLASNSEVIFLDEPTRGIDVGARYEIYTLMCKLTEEGKTLIMISSDMEELLGMSDRIIVLCEGKFAGEVARSEFSQKHIMELASGN